MMLPAPFTRNKQPAIAVLWMLYLSFYRRVRTSMRRFRGYSYENSREWNNDTVGIKHYAT